MANDRTININIKYNIDTGDVNKAKQASQQAQAATDQLRNSANQAGREGAKAYQPFIGSFETLRAKVLYLKEAITQSSDPTKIKALSDEYKRLKLQLDQTNKSLFDTGKAVKETADGGKSLVS